MSELPVQITLPAWVLLLMITSALSYLGWYVWSFKDKNAQLRKEKRDADMRRIEEANRLRDSQSLIERANEYWRRMQKPPGEDP